MSQLPQPSFNPQASVVSGFVQPYVQAPTPVQVQVGQGLDDIGPAFMAFSQTLAGFVGQQAQMKKMEDIQEGKAKLLKSRKTFQQLVKDGTIDPSANPWEAYGAAEADAVVSASRFTSQLRSDYEQERASNPAILDSIGGFDAFADDRVRQAASQGVDNPIWVNTFLGEINPQLLEMSREHAVSVGRARRERISLGLTVGIANEIGGLISDPLSYPPENGKAAPSIASVATNVQRRLDDVAQTIGGTEANKIATKVIMDLLVEYGDDSRIHDAAASIKTAGGKLVDTETYKASLVVSAKARDKARSELTLKKQNDVSRLLSSYVGPERIAQMSPADILAGKGIPSWEEVEPQVKKLGVGTDLYFKVKENYAEMKQAAIQSAAIDAIKSQHRLVADQVAQSFADASRDPAALVELSTRFSSARIQSEYETFRDTFNQAYGLNSDDTSKSINMDAIREESVRRFYEKATEDGPLDQGEIISLARMSRALGMKFVPGITERMSTSIEAFNQPNADPTKMPGAVSEAVEIYRTFSRMGESSLLGLNEETENFLRRVDGLIGANMPLQDAVGAAIEQQQQSGGATRSIKPIDSALIDEAFDEWRSGWWFDLGLANVSADVHGASRWKNAVESYAMTAQMAGVAPAQAVSRAKAWAADRTVELDNGAIFIVANPPATLGFNADAWDEVKNHVVGKINENLKARGLAEIDPYAIGFKPSSNSVENAKFQLVFTNQPFEDALLDAKYGGEDFAAEIPTSFTVQQLDQIATEISLTKKRPNRIRPTNPSKVSFNIPGPQ